MNGGILREDRVVANSLKLAGIVGGGDVTERVLGRPPRISLMLWIVGIQTPYLRRPQVISYKSAIMCIFFGRGTELG